MVSKSTNYITCLDKNLYSLVMSLLLPKSVFEWKHVMLTGEQILKMKEN